MGNTTTKIKLMRQIMGVKAIDIYQKIGVSQSNYSYYENGKINVDPEVEQKVTDMFLEWRKSKISESKKEIENLSSFNEKNITIDSLKSLLLK